MECAYLILPNHLDILRRLARFFLCVRWRLRGICFWRVLPKSTIKTAKIQKKYTKQNPKKNDQENQCKINTKSAKSKINEKTKIRKTRHKMKKSITAVCLFVAFVGFANASAIPQWAKSGICDEKDCAVGEASKKEGEASALARALKNLRLSLGTSVQANYDERTNSEGESRASAQTKVYASMQNIGYNVLDKFSDEKKIYIKIQYEPNKKILPNEEIGEFSIISNFEKLCKSRDLDGYYCVSLGKKYENGENDLAKNDNIALKYYEQGCKMGTLEGCVYAGNLIQNQNIQNILKGEKSSQKSKSFFAKACDGGLGLGCQKQASIEADALKRRDLYKQGCALDDGLSCAILGEIYEFGLAHLQKNQNTAEIAYEDSKGIDKNGDGAVILASKLKDKSRRIREYKRLCEANNARACALLGQEENNKNYLEKSAVLNSPRGLYFLALKQESRNTKIELLKKSCLLGEAKDFTKGCVELGNLYAPSQESTQYYGISCKSLFYEQEACERLYDISPKVCNNDTICEQIAQSRQSQLATNLQDLDSQESDYYQRYAKSSKTKRTYDEQNSLSPRLSLFLTAGLGATDSIKLDKITNSSKLDSSGANFVFAMRFGAEMRLLRYKITPYIAPYIGISSTDIFDVSDFKGVNSSQSKTLSAVMINAGSQAGIKLSGIRIYGIIDYGYRLFDKGVKDIPVPIRSALGFGGGIGYRFNFWTISIEYMQALYTYNGGELRDANGTRNYYSAKNYELRLNNSMHTAKSSVFLFNIGLAF